MITMGTREMKIASAELRELMKAVSEGHYETVNTILDKDPELVNQYVPPTYDSPLARVLNKKHIDYKMLDILVEHHVDFNYPINHHKETPIELACKNQDLQLFKYLVQHNASISERAPHFLLVNSTNIKYLTEDKIKNTCEIIKLMGGLEAVSSKCDAEGNRFGEQARKSQLINRLGGIVKYDYMQLLESVYSTVAGEGLDDSIITVLFGRLKNQLLIIKNQYNSKETYDQQNLKDSISLFFMTGGEIPPLRKVPESRIEEAGIDAPKNAL
ncbi:ankyrin repeat domain-containing protein [Legionella sp. PATHC032]|uniref:Dot/Icm T4SS effector AnkJ/LegA11 n=1 Tax=Legionella sp. PATHC032 TaxID=2992039 RepID=UPI001B2CA83D|nr:Dot/Icm T4SS effector AnkJ/LegA11 [Legionella sp. PATHC032]MCW8420448.1 ankyrin repeat domain-containing protein [Legionella sp. PATHC032]HAZ7572024.1 ankyrin repeat domain-containing protein [Legionella pneumophila]HBA1635166.1 ankyrin repeat domain-containing protein [Legionella pneumophila]